MCPTSSSLVSSDQSPDFQNSSLPFKCSWANLSLAWMCRFLSKGVLLGRWPWSPRRWRALSTVLLDTSTLEEARSATIIFAVVRGFLLTSLTSFLLRDLDIRLVCHRVCVIELCNDATYGCSRDSEAFWNSTIALPLTVGLHYFFSEVKA